MKIELEKQDIDHIADGIVAKLKPFIVSNAKGKGQDDPLMDVKKLSAYLVSRLVSPLS